MLNIIEGVSIVWFTFEFIVRFLTTTSFRKFLFKSSSIIDLLCIFPFYLGIFVGKNAFFLKIKYELQMLRVLRLLKLGRYSERLKSFTYALKCSSKAIIYLIVLCCFNVLLFSSFVYYAEQVDPDTAFTSILAACWWIKNILEIKVNKMTHFFIKGGA